MRRTAQAKDKSRNAPAGKVKSRTAAATREPRVADLAALIERSADAFRARSSKRSSGSVADERLAPVEGVVEAQIDFNDAVGCAIKIVAQHLLYVRKNFEALEKHDETEAARSVRAREEMREQLSKQLREEMKEQAAELYAALEAVGSRIESYGARLSELERRVGRELDEVRRSIHAGTPLRDAGGRRNKGRK